jgi:hypothetical protein
MSEIEIKDRGSSLKFFLISSLFLFISLISWSFSGPLSSGYDSTYHLANIWCAAGEQPGICENVTEVNGLTEADIPTQLTSEPQTDDYARVVLANSGKRSPFYSILNAFVTQDTTQSVLVLRVLNSFIAVLVFFSLLYFGNTKSRTASLSAWTFTIVPVIMATIWQTNPRSWGYLSVMSSSILLHLALGKNDFGKYKTFCLWLAFVFSVLLSFTSRVDASLFCIFTCGVVFVANLFRRGFLKPKVFAVASSVFLAIFLTVRLISSSIQWYTQFSFSAVFSSNQTLFTIIHLPENIADGLGLGLRYNDLGPNSIGIIGVALYAAAIASWLHSANRVQVFATAAVFGLMLLSMFQIAFYWPEANEASGVYVVALLTASLGLASLFSFRTTGFPSTITQKTTAIVLVSTCHALTLYSKFEWSIRSAPSNNSYSNLSLNGGWWWNSPIGPNVVYLLGAFAFPVWLIVSWATVDRSPDKISS